MKKFLCIIFLIAISSGLAAGQAGYIGLFFDPVYTDCTYIDAGPALVPVYVVHKVAPGVTGARFMVVPDGGFSMTYAGEIPHRTTYGTATTGVCIEYGDCLASDILLLTINYFAMGISPACSGLIVVPDPAAPSGLIEVMDCEGNVYEGGGSLVYINPDGSCDCGDIICLGGEVPCVGAQSKLLRRREGNTGGLCPISPVEYNSWGHIKALYN
jgi:hypothetical protein